MIRIAAFFIVILVIVSIFDLAVDHGLRQVTTSDFGVSNRLISGRINADILISGSSRAVTHYDSRAIQDITGLSTFNIGRNGSRSDVQLMWFLTYLKHNRPPKLVIQNIDLHSLAGTKELFEAAHYIPYLEEDVFYEGIRSIHPEIWKWKHLPMYAYLVEDTRFTWLLGLAGIVGYTPPEDRFLGFNPRYDTWQGDFDAFRRKFPNGVSTPVDNKGRQSLEALLATCKERSIPVVLVYSPEYYEVFSFQTNRSEIFEMMNTLAAESKVPFWDYSAEPISRQRALFRNSQHLNAEGATAFSTDLSRRLIQSGLFPPPHKGR